MKQEDELLRNLMIGSDRFWNMLTEQQRRTTNETLFVSGKLTIEAVKKMGGFVDAQSVVIAGILHSRWTVIFTEEPRELIHLNRQTEDDPNLIWEIVPTYKDGIWIEAMHKSRWYSLPVKKRYICVACDYQQEVSDCCQNCGEF